ncbi:hypothetical protein FOZ62_024484 [Perkinsus olseni]|uniref:Uncharacterized protein n=1 Tax=Perkinsus olseni TaxID=32597 RepID=A0A7J6RE44_PEROL|nr:hypothetical protein FOZ62_024484 [Perkinsus olseni]
MDRSHSLALNVAALEQLWEQSDLSGRLEELLIEISKFLKPRAPQLTELSVQLADASRQIQFIFYRKRRVMSVSSEADERAFVSDVGANESFELPICLPRRAQYNYDPSVDQLYVYDSNRDFLLVLDLASEVPRATTVRIGDVGFSCRLSCCGGKVFICCLLDDGRVSLAMVEIDEKRKSSHQLLLWTSERRVTARKLHDFVASDEANGVLTFAVMAGYSVVKVRLGLHGHSASIPREETWSQFPIAALFLTHVLHIRLLTAELMLVVTASDSTRTSSLVLLEYHNEKWFVREGDPTLRVASPTHLSVGADLVVHTSHAVQPEGKMALSAFCCTWE